jgi:nucleotide-binding universal stress UspA family protein
MQALPGNLGDNLLIAMSNRPASLDMVRSVARQLPNPAHVKITLMHYLAPIYWEHGGGTNREAIEEIHRQEGEWVEQEYRREALTEQYFARAQSILLAAGVPASRIRTKMAWDANDLPEAVLSELQAGNYSTVIIGRHHHTVLYELLQGELADVLRRHAENINVWVIEEEWTPA